MKKTHNFADRLFFLMLFKKLAFGNNVSKGLRLFGTQQRALSGQK